MNNLLQVESLNAFYGKSQITFDINMNVQQGEVAVIVGRNGVGKTTTIKSILGFVDKKDSKILFKDIDITAIPPYKISKYGMTIVPDTGGVFHNLTVEDNFKLSQQNGYFTWDHIFELFPPIKNLLKRKGAKLSGGERKMVGISKGLLMNPDLLIIDEPSEGLAPFLVRDIASTINRIEESISIIVADQNLSFIMSIADKYYIMDGGSIQLSGGKDDIKKEDIEKYLAI
ncbi:hypothetical protein AKJ60_01110 [candidate division MSBL1 archaeon SCGC-AAA385M11]|nr:hypothetical protein AKJ60_01110 [candidate division MSBL1 archaeon SCGC-AAA385M11]